MSASGLKDESRLFADDSWESGVTLGVSVMAVGFFLIATWSGLLVESWGLRLLMTVLSPLVMAAIVLLVMTSLMPMLLVLPAPQRQGQAGLSAKGQAASAARFVYASVLTCCLAAVAFSLSSGRQPHAVASAEAVSEEHRREAREAFERGEAKLEDEDYRGATDSFAAAIAKDDRFAEAYVGRARAYNHRAMFLEAIADATRALELAPNLAKAYQARANAHFGRHLQKQLRDGGGEAELELHRADMDKYLELAFTRIQQQAIDKAASAEEVPRGHAEEQPRRSTQPSTEAGQPARVQLREAREKLEQLKRARARLSGPSGRMIDDAIRSLESTVEKLESTF